MEIDWATQFELIYPTSIYVLHMEKNYFNQPSRLEVSQIVPQPWKGID